MGNCLPLNSSDGVSLLRNDNASSHDLPGDREQRQNQTQTYAEIIQPVFYPTPTVSGSRQTTHLTEDEQVKIAKRMVLIQHLPMGTYNGSKKSPECVICMIEFCVDEPVRFLPCMHIYHVSCIDDWLMRSLTCPSCMEPVDAALLSSYETT